MKRIFDGIEITQTMLKKIQTGGVCVSVDKFIDDWNYCSSINGLWIDEYTFQKVLIKIKNTPAYKAYLTSMINFKKNYFKYLRILKEYIAQIKNDINNSMPDNEFEILENKIKTLISTMNDKCESFYLICINLLN